jgi:Uma2 family endonuclease
MGVRELWLIDPQAREVEIRSFETGSTRLFKIQDIVRSEILPKLEIPVTALF